MLPDLVPACHRCYLFGVLMPQDAVQAEGFLTSRDFAVSRCDGLVSALKGFGRFVQLGHEGESALGSAGG